MKSRRKTLRVCGGIVDLFSSVNDGNYGRNHTQDEYSLSARHGVSFVSEPWNAAEH